jgi:hypothetical protein
MFARNFENHLSGYTDNTTIDVARFQVLMAASLKMTVFFGIDIFTAVIT